VSEGDAIDAMVERMAREEQDDIDRAAGQFILDAVADHQRRRQDNAEHPVLEVLRKAHQAKASEAEADQQ
jgi:hypothetical protein